ncbi:hypothetical protein N7526_001115 [Penicillium atrosanguineum]|nr:hypothetical protein N7526_001115 [Penicillium atrosanguineum]
MATSLPARLIRARFSRFLVARLCRWLLALLLPDGISSSRKLSLEDEDPLAGEDGDFYLEAGRPRGHSTYSISSAFDFGRNLFPLSQTQAAGYAPLRNPVNANAGSPGASLIVWAVAGILAWTGAASYAELGGAIPLNGGSQVYLSKIFGDLMGFLFTWCAVLVLKPGSAAIISIIFGEYIVRAFVGADVEHISPWINKGVAFGGLLAVTLFNCISTKIATRIGDIFMLFKFVALVGITVTGIVVAITGVSSSGSANQEWKTTGWFEGTNTEVSDFAVALYAGLWAFDGWDNTNYVTGEFKNPSRDLPRVIHTAMPLVILNTIAVQFGAKVFGSVGAVILALVVGASCFGALNATTFTSGRLIYAAGKEGYLPALFGHIGFSASSSPTPPAGSRLRRRSWARKSLSRVFGDETRLGYTPINAMAFNATLTTIYIVMGEFSTLVTFYGVAGYTFYFLTVLGLIVLRIREPHLERPYRTWITTPIIFCCVSLFLLSRAIISEPLQTLIVVAFLITGVPVYYWRIYKRDGKTATTGWKFWKWRAR